MSLYGMREIEKRLEAEQRGELASLRAEVERRRLPEDLVERLVAATHDGFDDQSAWSLFNDILAWNEQGGGK